MSMQNGRLISRTRPTRRILLVLCLTAGYMVLEALGGIVSNSLALLADAGHMLADVVALGISLLAFALSSRPPSHRATFGYYRAEVIAALFNGLILLVVSFFIVKEALLRFFNPSAIESPLMIVVATGGLLINIIGLSILHKDKANNLNIRGAWLHVFSDMLGSIGAVISGLLIYFFGWNFADSIASIFISALVSYSAIHLVLETLRVLMEHTPTHIDPRDVCEEILSIPDAIKIHDLHIWSITSGKEALSVHVIAREHSNYDKLLHQIQKMLELKFGIDHATIQIENECQAADKTC
jgi:cobalt-zinc-cadmium efflux system protein